jgi:hypothetical protein
LLIYASPISWTEQRQRNAPALDNPAIKERLCHQARLRGRTHLQRKMSGCPFLRSFVFKLEGLSANLGP